MSHFYLTLPSNSSEAYYPDNTLTGFTTKLHNKISLQGEWEVGLSDIIFPRTWFNLGKFQYVTIRCSTSGSSFNVGDKNFSPASFPRDYDLPEECFADILLSPGYFSNVEALVSELNRAINIYFKGVLNDMKPGNILNKLQKDGWPKFEYNRYSRKVYITVQSYTQISLSDDLIDIFGFDKSNLPLTNLNDTATMFRSDRSSDVNAGRHIIYVYCDILECVPVGDTMVPLLRTIDVNGEQGTMQQRDFVQPRYVPLQKKHFDSLTIDIRDGLGRKIPFESGTLIVTLHFRRANTSYFVL